MKMELLPCPFCGSEKIVPFRTRFICDRCETSVRKEYWNTRHSPWISVNTRLPDYLQEVLVIHNSNKCLYAIHSGNNSWYEYALINFEEERIELSPIGPGRITHWMPLSSYPKETE